MEFYMDSSLNLERQAQGYSWVQFLGPLDLELEHPLDWL